jgi:hypothetical protein
MIQSLCGGAARVHWPRALVQAAAAQTSTFAATTGAASMKIP